MITLVATEDLKLWHIAKDKILTFCQQRYMGYKVFPDKITDDMKYLCSECKSAQVVANSTEGEGLDESK